MTPVNPMVTSIKGWKNDRKNVQYDEQVFFDSKIRNKDQTANIILDLEKKIVENASHLAGVAALSARALAHFCAQYKCILIWQRHSVCNFHLSHPATPATALPL